MTTSVRHFGQANTDCRTPRPHLGISHRPIPPYYPSPSSERLWTVSTSRLCSLFCVRVKAQMARRSSDCFAQSVAHAISGSRHYRGVKRKAISRVTSG